MNNTENIKETVDPPRYSLTFPIYQTSAFKLPEGDHYRYGRENNPTVEELSRIISGLEHSESTTCFSSGMGAISTTLLSLLDPGNSLVIPADLFARTRNFASTFLRKWGISLKITKPGTEEIISSISSGTVVFLEAISNPGLRVYDVKKIAEAVHRKGGLVIVDATFATPVNIRPIELGSDISIHSLSKFIGGHNDLIAGSASGNRNLIERIDSFRRTLGTNLDPNTAFLTIRGIKTLQLRMEKINRNAAHIAGKLSEMGIFEEVIYPGLPNHPDHDVALSSLRGFGGVISFRLKEGTGQPLEKIKRLRYIEPANTLGSVNTVISHPMTMSHRSLNREDLAVLGVDERFFRLSVGIENPDEILEDLLLME